MEENMSEGFILQSSSPFPTPVLFAKDSDGGLRCCIIHRYINRKMIMNRYPLLLIRTTRNLLRRTRIYSKQDGRRAYNVFRVKEGDEHKVSFRTRDGVFEATVMQFGTTNAPTDFQGYINTTIWEAFDDFASHTWAYGNCQCPSGMETGMWRGHISSQIDNWSWESWIL